MTLPLPNLDNRTYAELLEEARSLIPSEYATWTDHNPTDPGIVLLELFSWLTEMVLYRVDQVTDKNIETFLQLLNGPDWQQQGETLDAAIQQTILDLRKRYRAVSVEDFEQLVLEDWHQSAAAQALGDAGKVARVLCLPQSNLDASRLCLSFNGEENNYVECCNDLGERSDLTLEIWVQPKRRTEYASILSGSQDQDPNSFQLDFNVDGWYRLLHEPQDIAIVEASQGTWQHLAISFNEAQGLHIYVNGEEQALNVDPPTITCFKLPSLSLGRNRSNSRFFQGLLADFRLWDYARSGDEIRADMNRRLTGKEEGLLVYWPLDEADGTTVYDHTPYGNNGDINGDINWIYSGNLPLLSSKQQKSSVDLVIVPERTQAVFEFNGTSNYINLPPEGLPVNQSITISFWTKGGDTLPKNNSLLYAGGTGEDSRSLNIHFLWSDNTIYFDCGNDGDYYDRISRQVDEVEGYIGQWSHWTFSKDATTGIMCIYCNGELFEQSGGPKNLSLTSSAIFFLGSFFDGDNMSNLYHGQLSEVRIWDRALSADEIRADMHCCLTGNEEGLVGYWPLDEGTGTTVYDRTPNENHGTVVGESNWVTDNPIPMSDLKHSLWTFLDQRRLLTTRHHIVGPTYVSVPITATLHLQPGALEDTICEQAVKDIRHFFDPLHGGEDGKGWPFGRAVYRSEVYGVLDQVPGVDYVEAVVLRGNGTLTCVLLQPHELVNVVIDRTSLIVS